MPQNNRLFYVAVFMALVALILGPFLVSTGYFLSVDWIYADIFRPIESIYYPNQYPWIVLQGMLAAVVPAFVVQKLVLVSLLGLSIWSTVFLLGRSGTNNHWGVLWGVLFFVLNSFFYARFAQGQVYLLLGHALFPFALGYLLYPRPSVSWYGESVKGAILLGLVASLSPHALYFFIPLLGAVFICRLMDNAWKRVIGSMVVIGAIILAINSYWLISVGKDTNIERFSVSDIVAFSTPVGPGESIYAKLLSLRGFWGESSGRIISTDTAWNQGGRTAFLIIFLLVLAGTYSRLANTENHQKSGDISLIALALIAYVLSFGVSGNSIFAPLNAFAFEHFPYYTGLREPQKWLSIVAIVYGFFAVHGLVWAIDVVASQKKESHQRPTLGTGVAILFIAIVIIGNPLMFFGAQGQIKGMHYPTSYASLDAELASKSATDPTRECPYRQSGITRECYDILALPWHMALAFPFTDGRVITNPIALLLPSQHVLFGDNIEIGAIYSQSGRLESKAIEKYVAPKGLFHKEPLDATAINWFLYDIRGLGIRHIVLMNSGDSAEYELLFRKYFGDTLMVKKITPDYTLYSVTPRNP